MKPFRTALVPERLRMSIRAFPSGVYRVWTLVLGAALLSACDGPATIATSEVRTLAEAGASNPTVAITDGGREVLVAWVAFQEGGGDVYLARLDGAGEAIGEPVRVNDIEGDADPHEQAPAQVVVGPNGDVYVMWQRKVEAPWLEFGGADLRFARSEDGGLTFAQAVTVNDNDRGSPARISFHDVAVSEDGRIHVSWIDARERDRAREMAHRAEGEGAGSDAARTHAGHGEMQEPGTEIRIATSADGGRTFTPSSVVDGDSCPCCRTSIAIGRDGAVYLSWRKIFAGGIRDIAVARADDNAAPFGAAHPIHPDLWEFSACPHAGPSLAIDGQNRLHAAWYNGAEGRQGLWYSTSTDGGESFASPTAILTDDWVPPSQARIAVDDDRIFVAFDDLRETRRRVRLARVADDHLVEMTDAFDGKAPAVAASAGLGALAWLDGEAVRVVTFATADHYRQQ